MTHWFVIGVSGVTCGGKTTLAQSLREYFQSQQNLQLWQTPYIIGDTQLISQDDYFLPVADLRHKWDDKLKAINFEVLTSLDMKQMLLDITWTLKGRYLARGSLGNMSDIAMSPNFEQYAPPLTAYHSHHHYIHLPQHSTHQFHHAQHATHHMSHQRHVNTGAQALATIMRVSSQIPTQLCSTKINILIVEGFMIFNQTELLGLCDMKFHFHLPYEKCFERRRKRTYDPPDVTGYFEVCVWPHYEKNFAQYRERKDITFLNGEISKERIFKFVREKIVAYFEERCEVECPPPHKFHVIPGCNSVSDMAHPVKNCPMEQQ